MAKYTTLSSLFTAIADAIRAKGSGSGKIIADDFPDMIGRISTGITPTGTKTITANGTHDVTNYASANVNVPASGITPSGSINITANGTHDVTSYASAVVNVPSSGITPSGSINITTNGHHDVTNYAIAAVNVPTPTQITVVRTVTLSSTTTASANTTVTLLSGDAFIKEHYSHAGFSAMWYLATPIAAETGVLHSCFQGNGNIGSSTVSRTGFAYRSSSASAIAMHGLTTKINGTGYAQHMRVNSSGNLLQHLASGNILKAGTYVVVLTCTT